MVILSGFILPQSRREAGCSMKMAFIQFSAIYPSIIQMENRSVTIFQSGLALTTDLSEKHSHKKVDIEIIKINYFHISNFILRYVSTFYLYLFRRRLTWDTFVSDVL